MTDIDHARLDRELKRGSVELLILSLLEARPRHGYELSKLIHTRSGGQLTFHIDSLYPLLYRLEERGWIAGKWVEKPEERRLLKGGACWLSSERPGRHLWRRCGA
jgi:DNA-binding PadR family transcriptional regulator